MKDLAKDHRMLVGREHELAGLNDVVELARCGMSGVMVVRGDAGIGKTALLDAVEWSARDLAVTRIQGIEREAQMGFGALHRLVLPYLDKAASLPSPQRNALDAAFGLSCSGPSDRFLLGLAALTLLSDVASAGRLLVLVDDAQWLDRDSLDVLAFVARRLDADGIAMIFTIREGLGVTQILAGLPELIVGGLDDACASTLLDRNADVPVSRYSRARVLSEAQGNPLALIELGMELSSDDPNGGSVHMEPLPIGRRIEERFLRQVRDLPPDTQLMLLIAATDSDGDPWRVRTTAQIMSLPEDAAAPALSAGLLVMEPTVAFRHPLVRSAVYSAAADSDRRAVHLALASLMDGTKLADYRAYHLAAAALGDDEAVAEALQGAATRARSRGGFTAETSFLKRAAELTPDRERRAERTLAAAEAALASGDAQYSAVLLDEARPNLSGPSQIGQAQRLDGNLRIPLFQSSLAPVLLLEAAQTLESVDSPLSREAFLEAFGALLVSGEFTEGTDGAAIARATLHRARAVADTDTPNATTILLNAIALRFDRPYPEAIAALRKANDILSGRDASLEEINRWRGFVLLFATELWDDKSFRLSLERLEEAARALGALQALLQCLLGWASWEIRAGRFAAARSRYDEAHDVVLATSSFVDYYSLLDVELLAWQGDDGQARSKIHSYREASIAFGAGSAYYMAELALCILELGQGHYEEAYLASKVVVEGGLPGWECQALANLIEASTRCNADHDGVALSVLDNLTERASASGTPWALGLLTRSQALMGHEDSTDGLYQAAINHFGATSLLTELARSHLVYGEWLRRQKRRTEARDQLSVAYELFAKMGAAGFAERARVELLATGERARVRQESTQYDLTARELQIAELAAERATSREIAAQLFISPNTVDYHLRAVFQKLGISSRRQLPAKLPTS